MSEKELMPRCPYCGATMHENLYAYKNGGGWCNFECPNCGAMSPKKENSESCNKAELAAYFVAKKRYEEPNRVLTWEEVRAACAVPEWVLLWREWNVKDAALYVEQICPAYELHNEDVVFVSPGDETEGRYNKAEYGKRLRCWICKPTMNEMENTPWEDE